MPGPLTRPPNMRDVLYNHNWRVGYFLIPSSLAILAVGAVWVKYKRDRYDRVFEKFRDPAYKQMIRDNTSLMPEKYNALIKRLGEEMKQVRAKYGIEED